MTALVSRLDLPPSAPYPNSITASADGTLYVGGLFGEIVKYVPTSTAAQVVVPQVGPPGSVLANVTIDTQRGILYACDDAFNATAQNPFANPDATLFAYDLDGNLQAAYPLPNQGSSLCEDIAVDADGAVYVSDAFSGTVDKLAAPVGASSTLTTWATSALLQADPNNPVPPFGAHGLAVMGSNVYVDNFSTSALLRIPIAADGSADVAGIAPQTASIINPERLLALDSTHLLVSEDVWCGAGDLALLTSSSSPESWDVTVLENGILGATGFTLANGSYYTVESQVCGIITQLAGGPAANPELPFWIDRVDAE